MNKTVLYDYWRSSASYRVRIALHCLEVPFESQAVDLLADEHSAPNHLLRNPQGFVPVLDIDGLRLTQSLAIIEYLNETRQAGFLPADSASRARVRALANVIAMDTHPICNPSVLSKALQLADDPENAQTDWMRHFIRRGLEAFETLLHHPGTGQYCQGDAPGLADFCLIPQLYNARRWLVDYSDLTHVNSVEQSCVGSEPFRLASPEIARKLT